MYADCGANSGGSVRRSTSAEVAADGTAGRLGGCGRLGGGGRAGGGIEATKLKGMLSQHGDLCPRFAVNTDQNERKK